MANDKKKKSGNFGRVLYYFWKALMQNKIRVILLLVLIPIYVFIMNILVPLIEKVTGPRPFGAKGVRK